MIEKTPSGNRLHIGLFGRRNVGKSSLINALTGQQVALVSNVAGTTTDPVMKAMEIHPLGPCVLIDTAGIDDGGDLGMQRVERTLKAVALCDIALLVTDCDRLGPSEQGLIQNFKNQGLPHLIVRNKADQSTARETETGDNMVPVSAVTMQGLKLLLEEIAKLQPEQTPQSLVGRLAQRGDQVLLVMPQDPQAPKGRLILPQVQTLRDLIDKGCMAQCCSTAELPAALSHLTEPPHLIITDSQVFDTVEKLCPDGTMLTSFSVLMAAQKGDIDYFKSSAEAIGSLTPQSRVLIAEACTHAPLPEDIGREKIPRMLRTKIGNSLRIDTVAGKDFPDDLSPYDLVIHCGGCMFTRHFMLERIAQARRQHIPMTNYGIAIAYFKGILHKVALP